LREIDLSRKKWNTLGVRYKWIVVCSVFLGIGGSLLMFWLLGGVRVYKNVLVSGLGPFSDVVLTSPQGLKNYIDYLEDNSLLDHDKFYWIRYESGKLPKLDKMSFWNRPEAIGIAPTVGCSFSRSYLNNKLKVRDFFFSKSIEKTADRAQLINKFGLRCLSDNEDISRLGALYDQIEYGLAQYGNVFEIR